VKEVSTTGLILFMSIPLVSDPLNVFDKMISVAQYVASELSGDLQDPDAGVIDYKGVEKIRKQVISIGEAFHRVGILPGSDEALRLF
jgi:FtsZ-interacting cell division protein ZipA